MGFQCHTQTIRFVDIDFKDWALDSAQTGPAPDMGFQCPFGRLRIGQSNEHFITLQEEHLNRE